MQPVHSTFSYYACRLPLAGVPGESGLRTIRMQTLAHTLLESESEPTTRWVLMLHGILGSGGNLRSIARRMISATPGWGAVLVDLRMHGDSLDLPPPHTIANAAKDLDTLASTLNADVGAVFGHSFGGKVALEWVRSRHGELARAIIVDSLPGRRPSERRQDTSLNVLDSLSVLPKAWPSRAAFQSSLAKSGYSPALVSWLSMNLMARNNEYAWRLDLDAIRALLLDYFELDLWPVVETPPGSVVIDLVVASQSTVFDETDRERARRAGVNTSRVRTHFVDADHWVHVDSPDALVGLWTATE